MSAKGRGRDGKFQEGNPGGPGNPFARRVARLRAVILDAVSEEDLRAIIGAMVERAKEGDMAAAREVLSRVIGKPVETPDPDRLDVEEKKLEGEAVMATLAAAFGGQP